MKKYVIGKNKYSRRVGKDLFSVLLVLICLFPLLILAIITHIENFTNFPLLYILITYLLLLPSVVFCILAFFHVIWLYVPLSKFKGKKIIIKDGEIRFPINKQIPKGNRREIFKNAVLIDSNDFINSDRNGKLPLLYLICRPFFKLFPRSIKESIIIKSGDSYFFFPKAIIEDPDVYLALQERKRRRW